MYLDHEERHLSVAKKQSIPLVIKVLDEGVSHSVTPLWCAAVSGRLAVVKVLLR